MVISMNRGTSGFRKWSEAQQLKRLGEARPEVAEGGPQISTKI
jgi:hypothetical protein